MARTRLLCTLALLLLLLVLSAHASELRGNSNVTDEETGRPRPRPRPRPPRVSNDRPVIGILTQPTHPPMDQYGGSYIAASYVKYVESAGARVVPVRYDASDDELNTIFNGINGLLFPGGGADFKGQFLHAGQFLFNKVLQANKNGDYFPLWGTCLGFEFLMVLASNNTNILDFPFDSENLTLPLSPTNAAAQSRLLGIGNCPADVLTTVYTKAVTMNNHSSGITIAKFSSTPALANFFAMLSWNVDRVGRDFVSTVEAVNYPIYGSQWHPEKNQFEWNPAEVIDHSSDAVRAMTYFSQFLVNEARNSAHQFSSPAELEKRLIYNFNPVYTENVEPDFEQCYFW